MASLTHLANSTINISQRENVFQTHIFRVVAIINRYSHLLKDVLSIHNLAFCDSRSENIDYLVWKRGIDRGSATIIEAWVSVKWNWQCESETPFTPNVQLELFNTILSKILRVEAIGNALSESELKRVLGDYDFYSLDNPKYYPIWVKEIRTLLIAIAFREEISKEIEEPLEYDEPQSNEYTDTFSIVETYDPCSLFNISKQTCVDYFSLESLTEILPNQIIKSLDF